MKTFKFKWSFEIIVYIMGIKYNEHDQLTYSQIVGDIKGSFEKVQNL